MAAITMFQPPAIKPMSAHPAVHMFDKKAPAAEPGYPNISFKTLGRTRSLVFTEHQKHLPRLQQQF